MNFSIAKWHRRLAAIIMIPAIAGTTFSKAIALLDYQLNRDYIAAKLCENKNKPGCCCHGKCFLKKQLQKDEDTGNNTLPFSKDKFEVSLFCEEETGKYFSDPKPENIFFDHYLLKRHAIALSGVFHPPTRM
ncbi:MAG TPA: hypothetical protein VKR32_00840 [Puia sp.]|nr:hypothetical protein [Puia sp.]